jgi:hypothetical protein
MSTAYIPNLPTGFEAWVQQSRVASCPAAMVSARAAMHSAVRSTPAAASSRRRFRVAVLRLDALIRHPLRLTAGSIAAAAAVILALGWNAGPGTPLHSIQLARQDASLVLASSTQALDLRLQYAEARLQAAAAGSDRHDNLEEAASLLTAALSELPASHTDPLWQRWSRDEGILAALLTSPGTPGPSTDTSGQGGGHDGSVLPNGSSGSGNGGGHGRDDSSGGSVAGSAASPSPDDHGGGSGSGGQPALIAPSQSSDGGGGDQGGGGGSSSPDPSGGGGGGHGS